MTNRSEFLKLLKQLQRERPNGHLDNLISRIEEDGSYVPDINTLVEILDSIPITLEAAQRLADLAGYSNVNILDKLDSIKSSAQRIHQIPVVNMAPLYLSRDVSIVNPDLQSLTKEIGKLTSQISEIQSKINDPATLTSPSVITDLQALKEAVQVVSTTAQDLTAPIRIPSRDLLAVDLIPVGGFERLEEYRADENRWFGLFGICAGFAGGVVVNVVTGGTMSSGAWVAFALFLAAAAIMFWATYTYKQRGDRLRDQMLSRQTVLPAVPLSTSVPVPQGGASRDTK